MIKIIEIILLLTILDYLKNNKLNITENCQYQAVDETLRTNSKSTKIHRNSVKIVMCRRVPISVHYKAGN